MEGVATRAASPLLHVRRAARSESTFVELFTLRSHVITGAVDWLVTRDYGIRGVLAGERRAEMGFRPSTLDPVGAPSTYAGERAIVDAE